MTTRILLDSAIPLYAAGSQSPFKAPARELLAACATGDFDAYASVELIQEFVFHRLRMTHDRPRAVAEGRSLRNLITVLPFDDRVLDRALVLIESTQIGGRDAVHAATACVNDVPIIASPDHAFDGIPGLKRLDAADLVA